VVVDHRSVLLREEIDGIRRDFNFKKTERRSAAGHLESGRGDFHFYKPRAGIRRSVGEFAADAGGCLDILGEKENITTPASARELRRGCPI
jgi:hypothetical protein